MAEDNIAAVLQPADIYWEGDLLFRDVGARRANNYKPARKYLDHGVVVTSSSDSQLHDMLGSAHWPIQAATNCRLGSVRGFPPQSRADCDELDLQGSGGHASKCR